MNLLTLVSLKAIRFYQKHISPYKGFSCPYRTATNEVSCSGYGAKVIKRFGLLTGYKLLQRRFYDCQWHAQKSLKHKAQARQSDHNYLGYNLRRRQQAGFVDCDCGGCDMPDCHMPDCGVPKCSCGWLDAFELCDLDCGSKKSTQSSAFTTKRDMKNQNKYDDMQKSSEASGVSLKKEDDSDD